MIIRWFFVLFLSFLSSFFSFSFILFFSFSFSFHFSLLFPLNPPNAPKSGFLKSIDDSLLLNGRFFTTEKMTLLHPRTLVIFGYVINFTESANYISCRKKSVVGKLTILEILIHLATESPNSYRVLNLRTQFPIHQNESPTPTNLGDMQKYL